MTKPSRSRFWIVSTHVLTTGLVWPFLANVAAVLLCVGLHLALVPALMVTLTLLALGYVGGTYYSLAYLRKAASSENWSACTTPAIATFVVLSIVGLAVTVTQFPAGPGFIGGFVLFYIVILLAFSRITQRGFAILDGRYPPAGGVTFRQDPAPAVRTIEGGWECSRCGSMNRPGRSVCATCRLQT